ncbi:MAG: radical SAM family heme chaperone HemW [Saccharofermentanales bacterium]
MVQKKSASVYIHIPFCASKCFYCDFNSYAGQDDLIDRYFEALLKEIDVFAASLSADPEFLPNQLKTIFFGGGTPTYVPSSNISSVVQRLRDRFGIEADCEITMECNPGTVDEAKIADYRTCGVNRISIGLQSASDRLLALAGRTHRAADFDRTVNQFIKAGFRNISADLIEGLPGQKTKNLMDSLTFVTGFDLEHISLYSLSIEQGTPFYNLYHADDDLLPDAAEEREMYHLAIDYLEGKGFSQYEISNFAKDGHQSRHNVSCWRGQEYFGFGAGAHSYFDGCRYSNISSIESYISRMNQNYSGKTTQIDTEVNQVRSEANADIATMLRHRTRSPALEDLTVLSTDDRRNEFFMLGLRLTEGISEAEFTDRFGPGFDKYRKQLDALEGQGLLSAAGGRYRLTRYGLDYANKVFIEFV